MTRPRRIPLGGRESIWARRRRCQNFHSASPFARGGLDSAKIFASRFNFLISLIAASSPPSFENLPDKAGCHIFEEKFQIITLLLGKGLFLLSPAYFWIKIYYIMHRANFHLLPCEGASFLQFSTGSFSYEKEGRLPPLPSSAYSNQHAYIYVYAPMAKAGPVAAIFYMRAWMQ